MKKIMFNEHYGLETATLNGSKTRTSRIITVNSIYEKFIDCLNRDSEVEYEHDRFVIYNTDGRYYTYRTRYLIGNIIPIGSESADEVAMQNIEKLIPIMKELRDGKAGMPIPYRGGMKA